MTEGRETMIETVPEAEWTQFIAILAHARVTAESGSLAAAYQLVSTGSQRAANAAQAGEPWSRALAALWQQGYDLLVNRYGALVE